VRDAIIAGLRDGAIAAPNDDERAPGVVLVGGGPGNPELVTLAARRALSEADVVVADRLAPRELLDELSPDVELVDVAKLPRGRAAAQEEINRVIVDRALAGKRVVRFKGGDSFVYGRGYEEALACEEAGVPWTVIPGLTSAISVPTVAGIPVTHRGVAHDFTVISGHLPPDHADSLVEWEAVARLRGTLVLLMAVQNLPEIAARLVRDGRAASTPVAIVSEGTMPGERTVLSTLGHVHEDMTRASVRPPAIVVVGEVVAVANRDRYQRPG
jgi:uroporphyrin-III C-methyltransferase/precorrin-2 dehydrogenase/sirohydrochlorin ferrochelatase